MRLLSFFCVLFCSMAVIWAQLNPANVDADDTTQLENEPMLREKRQFGYGGWGGGWGRPWGGGWGRPWGGGWGRPWGWRRRWGWGGGYGGYGGGWGRPWGGW